MKLQNQSTNRKQCQKTITLYKKHCFLAEKFNERKRHEVPFPNKSLYSFLSFVCRERHFVPFPFQLRSDKVREVLQKINRYFPYPETFPPRTRSSFLI